MNGLAAGYGELAFAILVWEKRQQVGTTRAELIEAEQKLKDLAESLRAAGYRVGV